MQKRDRLGYFLVTPLRRFRVAYQLGRMEPLKVFSMKFLTSGVW